jgi:hypothetical protein
MVEQFHDVLFPTAKWPLYLSALCATSQEEEETKRIAPKRALAMATSLWGRARVYKGTAGEGQESIGRGIRTSSSLSHEIRAEPGHTECELHHHCLQGRRPWHEQVAEWTGHVDQGWGLHRH